MGSSEARKLLFVGADNEQHQCCQQIESEHVADIGEAVLDAHLVDRKKRAEHHAHDRQDGDKKEFVFVGHSNAHLLIHAIS